MVRTLPGRCCLASRSHRWKATGWGLCGPLHTAVWPQALGTPVPVQPCVRQAQSPPGASGCLLIRRGARSPKGKGSWGLGTCKVTSQTDGPTDTLSDPPLLGRTAGKGWAQVSLSPCLHLSPGAHTRCGLSQFTILPRPLVAPFLLNSPLPSATLGETEAQGGKGRGSGLLLCRVRVSLGPGRAWPWGWGLLPVLCSLLPLDLKLHPVWLDRLGLLSGKASPRSVCWLRPAGCAVCAWGGSASFPVAWLSPL